MGDIFLKTLNMSIAASWLICPVTIESPASMIPDSVGSGELISEWTNDYIGNVDIHHPNSVHYDAAIGAGREPISDGEGSYYIVTRRDHWWKPLGFLILTVHWFNPLCRVAYVLLCRDIELACDEKVIRQMDLDGKKRYSTALLECSTGRRLVTICRLAFGEAGVKERVKNVWNYKKPAFWVIVVAVIACGVVTVIFATNPVKKQPPMNDLQLISADVMDLRSDPPILYSMNTSELDELSSRLKDINMTGVDDDLMGMTPYYSITITDQKVEGFSVSGFDTDGNHVGILYQGHYYRVQDDAFSRYLQNICAGYQRADALPRLTLDDVVTLSKKGNALSWSDFERYQGREVGSGLYIMRYEIDELFDVLVGGVPDETPWYIYLRVNNEADDRIDIRTEDVSTFVEAHRNDVPKVVEPTPDGGGKPAPEEPDFSTLSEEQTAIRQAILEHNRSADLTSLVPCASFAELASFVVDGSDFAEYIHYGWALYEEYRVTDSGLETVTGSHIPVAITFREDSSGNLTLEEYWEPRDGSYYAQDIREKFSAQ